MEEPDKILDDWLYLGSLDASQNADALYDLRITDVFSAIDEPEDDIAGIQYTWVDLIDAPDQDLSDAIDFVIPYLNEIRDSGGKVLVHCYAGISRSAALVIAYLILEYGFDYDSALRFVRSKRPEVNPNHGFERQLRML